MRVLGFCVLLVFLSCNKREDPEFLQKKLVGTWQGTGEHSYGTPSSWEAEFTFEENGYYYAKVLSVTAGSTNGVFDVGGEELYNIDRKFVVHYVDAYGKAGGRVDYPLSSNSTYSEAIYDLAFSNRYNTLNFRFGDEFPIYYTLSRQ